MYTVLRQAAVNTWSCCSFKKIESDDDGAAPGNSVCIFRVQRAGAHVTLVDEDGSFLT